MAADVDFWFVQSVTVDTFLGVLADGEQWDTGNAVSCWVEEDIEETFDSTGSLVVSKKTRVFAPLAQRTRFTTGSKVVLPSGRVARVAGVAVHDSGSLALGLDHLEVALV